MPATLSLIRTIFTDARQRTLAVAIWAASFSVGMSIGPVMGGLVLQTFGWRAAFFLAVPLLMPMVAARGCCRSRKNPAPGSGRPGRRGAVDAHLVPIVYAHQGIRPRRLTALVAGSLLLGLLGRRRPSYAASSTRRRPLLDMRLFKIRAFTAAILANLLSFFSVVGFTFFEAQQLQLVLGLEPGDRPGLLMIPGAVGAIVAGLWAVAAAQAGAQAASPGGWAALRGAGVRGADRRPVADQRSVRWCSARSSCRSASGWPRRSPTT